jgi:hypothetical protein
MRHRQVLISLIAGIAIVIPAALMAQQPAPKAKQQQRAPEPDYEVEELTPGQIRRAQENESRALRNAPPQAPPSAAPTTPAATAAPKVAAPQATPARAIACSGAFGKDSNHIKLATVFTSQNITFTEVDAGTAKIMATVLFPKDPKRRLEVWWQNEAARSGLHLIVINGQSTWTAPKGLRLGLGLAAIEKLNGKPFKLQGFDKDGGNSTDWQGGALAALPGGCKVGIKLAPNPKAPQAVRDEVNTTAEFTSTDASMKAATPTITEIIIGY